MLRINIDEVCSASSPADVRGRTCSRLDEQCDCRPQVWHRSVDVSAHTVCPSPHGRRGKPPPALPFAVPSWHSRASLYRTNRAILPDVSAAGQSLAWAGSCCPADHRVSAGQQGPCPPIAAESNCHGYLNPHFVFHNPPELKEYRVRITETELPNRITNDANWRGEGRIPTTNSPTWLRDGIERRLQNRTVKITSP